MFWRVALLLVLLIFHLPVLLFSQASNSLAGSVSDEISRRPIEFASIELLQLPDSSRILGTTTDKKGKFQFDALPAGNYALRFSFIGYETRLAGNIQLKDNTTFNTEPVFLQPSPRNLGEVTVTSRKQSLVTGIDRKVYNVDQDIMSRSGSASDILRNIPSVEVDIEGGVALRGSGDVMILVNGKPSPLMGRSRAEILQQLPANTIERIEVITNPSARFRPDGVSGIINIVLKKNVKNGFNGSAIANVGSHDRYNGNISLNYRPGKFNFFSSYSIRRDYRRRVNTISRESFDGSSNTSGFFDQYSYSIGRPFAHIVNGGFDYTINDQSSFGVSGSYFHRKMTRNDIASNYYYDDQKILLQQFDRHRNAPEFDRHHSVAAYFLQKFKKEDHELRIEYNGSPELEVERNYFTNSFTLPAKPTALNNTILTAVNIEKQLTVDYTNPLGEKDNLQLGYDGLYTTDDLDLFATNFDDLQNSFIIDLEKSNRFIYRENIHALYGTYERTLEKWGFSIGLRAEQAFTKSRLITKDSTVPNDYFNLYPTLHLGYALKEGSELQLNYSKRVNRPEGDDLNPFPEYQDPRNLHAGNPSLKPEIIHSVEFGYKWQHKNFSFVPSIYYRYKENGFTSVTLALNDSTLLTTEQNLSNDRSAGLELIFSVKSGKWFSANLGTNFFYNRINSENLGFIQNKSLVSMSTNFNSSFTITKQTVAQLSMNFRSARLTPQGRSYPVTVINMGLRQELFGNKVSLILTASDIFATQRQKNELSTATFFQTSTSRRDARIIFIGFSYRFGIIKKEKEEKLDFDNTL